MPHKPSPQRKPTRLKGYDYSQSGGYYVTICTHQKQQLLSDVIDENVVLSAYGEIANTCWVDLPNHYPHVRLDRYVIMPNHVHGIVFLAGEGLQTLPYDTSKKRHGLSEIIRGFKTYSARRINEYRSSKGTPVWQRSFYDHIIRQEDDLQRIREYILYNPAKWESDEWYE